MWAKSVFSVKVTMTRDDSPNGKFCCCFKVDETSSLFHCVIDKITIELLGGKKK